ncbi:nuclease-related domain-containing protein [Inhella sp.]|uniref:nuclease-related domain-containing protein n=1 Tax=Inhella sp. TaxID=1921806 RepID=UPI0035B4FA23
MLIKSADDKTKRLRLLEELQASPVLDARQREWLKDEYWRVKKGIDGEREAAFHIDSLLRDGENHAVLHDLRIKAGEDEAQIDHLVINRAGHFLLIETKCYGGHLQINEEGEFTVSYDGGKRFGVPSPLSQSLRHERVLARLLERLEIAPRIGSELRFHHVVLLHPKAIISRPDAKRFDTSNVIKADQFAEWRERFVDRTIGGLGFFSAMANLRSSQTVREWGEKIARQHRPADPFDLPDFMRPKAAQASCQSATAQVLTPRAEAATAAGAVASAGSDVSSTAPVQAFAQPADLPVSNAPTKRLICATCGIKISYPEGKFCWNNPRRFGGQQYCREHQGQFT